MTAHRWMTGFSVLGVAARLVRYFQHFHPLGRRGLSRGVIGASFLPLTVAEYQDPGKPYHAAARDGWLTGMAQPYALTTTEDVPMHRYDWTGRRFLAAISFDSSRLRRAASCAALIRRR